MRKINLIFILLSSILFGNWGFFGHKKINQQAIYSLPPEMISFFKANREYIIETSCNPDRRRYAIPEEAPRHYIDLDRYGENAINNLPRFWTKAVDSLGEDFLNGNGILPWYLNTQYLKLRDAFFIRDPAKIMLHASEIGHYIADAHVPLHTTSNYDGQLTDQVGIHGFWESRLPELYSNNYDFLVGKAQYIENVQMKSWDVIKNTNQCLDSVLRIEQELNSRLESKKYAFETKGKQTVKVFSQQYAYQYHKLLNGMVERQMRKSIKMTADVWFTAWVDAGQPDLTLLKDYKPTEGELKIRREELKKWKEMIYQSRQHEVEN